MTIPLQLSSLLALALADPSLVEPPPLVIGIVLGLCLLLFVFQIWMVLDCLLDRTDPIHYSERSRGGWIRHIFFFGIIGAFQYFFAVRRPRIIRRRERRERASQQPAR